MAGNRALQSFTKSSRNQIRAVLAEFKAAFGMPGNVKQSRVPSIFQHLDTTRAFFDRAQTMGLSTYLITKIEHSQWRSQVPTDISEYLESLEERTKLNAILFEDEWAEVLTLLSEAEIPMLLMGDAAMSLNWKNPEHRPLQSIDFLIPKEAFNLATRALGQKGFKLKGKVQNNDQPLTLTLHRKSGAPVVRLVKDSDDDQSLWENSVLCKIKNYPKSFKMLSAEDLFVERIKNSIHLMNSSTLVPSPLVFVDLIESAKRLIQANQRFNWDHINLRLKDKKISNFGWLVLSIAQREFSVSQEIKSFFSQGANKIQQNLSGVEKYVLSTQLKLDHWYQKSQVHYIGKKLVSTLVFNKAWLVRVGAQHALPLEQSTGEDQKSLSAIQKKTPQRESFAKHVAAL